MRAPAARVLAARVLAARVLAAWVLAAGPALAEPPLTAEAFDALTLGKTMTWAEFGSVYGVEQYLPDRRVRWTFSGGDCLTGYWYPEGQAICFQYEDRDNPVCWVMAQAGDSLTASDTDDAPGVAPVIVTETGTPMACLGPGVGV